MSLSLLMPLHLLMSLSWLMIVHHVSGHISLSLFCEEERIEVLPGSPDCRRPGLPVAESWDVLQGRETTVESLACVSTAPGFPGGTQPALCGIRASTHSG